jgi:hypothetical protein
MDKFTTIQGRRIGADEIAAIRQVLAAHPHWPRSRVSVELCRLWDLHGHDGQLKDMACRNLLLKLERAGVLTLPPRRRPGPNAHRNRHIAPVAHDTTPVGCELRTLEPLSVNVVQRGSDEERLFNCLVRQYHYLGLRSTVGENLKYLIRAGCGRPLGCLLFGSAAWKTQPRDRFVGWDHPTRERNLQLVTNNTRFLVLPWVCVPCLASRMLSLAARRVRTDWEAKYGHPVHLLETFVDTSRFRGTCYRAANWMRLGHTTGRTRNNRCKRHRTTVKDVYVLPLSSDFRRELCR